MCTETEGIKSLSKTETSSAILANPVIVGDLLEHIEVDLAFNDNDEVLLRFGEAVSVEELCNKSNACEALSDSNELPTKPCAPNATARVSSSLENRRVLPMWTRKIRELATVSTGKRQRLSG